jgi:hypothetical protein
MMCRSLENTIYFASVNYPLRFQKSATRLITSFGQCQAYLPYGEEGVLVQAINVEEATGLLSLRYAPERHQEFRSVIKNSGWNECLAPYAAAPLALCDPVDAGALEGYQQSKYVYGKTISGNT